MMYTLDWSVFKSKIKNWKKMLFLLPMLKDLSKKIDKWKWKYINFKWAIMLIAISIATVKLVCNLKPRILSNKNLKKHILKMDQYLIFPQLQSTDSQGVIPQEILFKETPSMTQEKWIILLLELGKVLLRVTPLKASNFNLLWRKIGKNKNRKS